MTNSQPSQYEIWEEVRKYYFNKFGTAPELVDIVSVFDILKMCASGSSNKSIAGFLGEHLVSVMETIDNYLGHMGWEIDLNFSPLKIYKELDTKDKESFVNVVTINFGYHHSKLLDNAFTSCEIVSKMERLIDEKWI